MNDEDQQEHKDRGRPWKRSGIGEVFFSTVGNIEAGDDVVGPFDNSTTSAIETTTIAVGSVDLLKESGAPTTSLTKNAGASSTRSPTIATMRGGW